MPYIQDSNFLSSTRQNAGNLTQTNLPKPQRIF